MNKKQFDHFKAWFTEYVASFYGADEYVNAHIKLKEEHTYRVCEEMVWLTNQLNLSEQDKLTAGTIAIFHDVGRFEQFAKYRTYMDNKSVNHCLVALEVLGGNNLLDELDAGEKLTVETAIKLHGGIKLPDNLDGETALFAKLIRDVDKLDVYRVVIEGYKQFEANPEDFFLEVEFPAETYCSAEIIETLLKGRRIDFRKLRTLHDAKLLQLSWVFDVNFPQTFIRIMQRRFLDELITLLPEKEEAVRVKKFIFDYVDARIAGFD